MSGPEDHLLEALRARQQAACEQFVDAHYRGVYGLELWLTNDAEAAADLTQEAFAAFWESLDHADRPIVTDLKAWLYGIARNRWRKWCRDARPVASPLDEALEVPDQAPGPEALTIASFETAAVARAVAALPADYREALVLKVFQELSYRQIAAALAISEELARWRVYRARQRLRAALVMNDAKEESGDRCT